MTFSQEQLEWIVAEVIRRLQAAGGSCQCAKSAAGELKLTERVVTLRSVEGRLDGIGRVVVGRKTIVTPSVKDELKQRKIELVFMAG